MRVLHRVWKANETGSDTSNLSIIVPDNSSSLTTRLPAESNNKVYMLIDTDTNFSVGATIVAGTQSGTEWIFNSVDLDDTQFFTFATDTPIMPGAVIQSSGLVNGVYYEFYTGYDSNLDDGINANLLQVGYLDNLTNPDDPLDPEFAQGASNTVTQVFKTKLLILTGGQYSFRMSALDDIGSVYINGSFVFSGNNATITSTPVNLSAGYNDLEVRFTDAGGTRTMQLQYSGTDSNNAMIAIPDNKFFVDSIPVSAWYDASQIVTNDGSAFSGRSDSSQNGNNLTNVAYVTSAPRLFKSTPSTMVNFNPSVQFNDGWISSADQAN